ncbi:glycosyltransferase [Haloferula helveola]|uniref:Glycosyltransferase n=1 Tax=Haloferula helveola TaxID=490095 RepID=A0ABM7RDY0_9BACT|nr:glycosyltransferase [Haloferula helveola]
MKDLRAFIGWDSREAIAYEVARASLLANASVPVMIEPIKLDDLLARGVYEREIDPLASTEFTYSRFFTPWLAGYSGWALFCDCDFLFFGDVAKLAEYQDPSKAVVCVHHDYRPTATTKMDGRAQSVYPRKNWSSFMLINCSHPSARRLTPDRINRESAAYLHRLQWAACTEIGELPGSWNWLEGWDDRPKEGVPDAVHFTSGGPWFENCRDVDYGPEWTVWADRVDPGWRPS